MAFDKVGLIEILQNAKDPESSANRILARWVESPASIRPLILEDYTRLFLTRDGSPLKKAKVDHPGESLRMERLYRKRNALGIAQKSLTLFAYGQRIFWNTNASKTMMACWIMTNLIEKNGSTAQPHAEYGSLGVIQLDGGIDHILIDEAQDTNPPQWQVILSLADDFFRPDKAHRTLFVVGDAKQSIYSFQGAKPEDFATLRDHFSLLSTKPGQTWRDVNLSISFRSTPRSSDLWIKSLRIIPFSVKSWRPILSSISPTVRITREASPCGPWF